jgi:hypothetical protein
MLRKFSVLLFLLASILTVSCTDSEALEIEKISSENPAQLESRENPEGVQDGTQLLEDALILYDVVQGESDSPTTYTGEELAKGLSDMYNVLWGNPGAAYADQITLFYTVDVTGITSFNQDQATDVYDNINAWLTIELEAYPAEDAGLRFISISKPIVRESGNFLHVYANIGQNDGGEVVINGSENSVQWAHFSNFGVLITCQSSSYADREITRGVNNLLGNQISVINGGSGGATANRDNKGRIVFTILGNAAVALDGASINPSSLDADVVLDIDRFDRSNGPDYSSSIPCNTSGPVVRNDQYEIFRGCRNTQPSCLTWQDVFDYTAFHNSRGDDVVETEWLDATSNSATNTMRVGGYVAGFVAPTGPGSETSYHFSKFFYGAPFEVPMNVIISPF